MFKMFGIESLLACLHSDWFKFLRLILEVENVRQALAEGYLKD